MKAMSRSMLATSAAMALFAGGAMAQTNGTFLLTSSNTVSPSSPSTTIEIWAAWEEPVRQHMFGASNYDITAGDGVFSNPINIMLGPGSSAGVANGTMVTGGANGQLWFAPRCGLEGCPTTSPSLLASYTWTATDFTPRTVDLFTSNTTLFMMIHAETGGWIELFPDEFTPGAGAINVVPGPAAWYVVAVPLAAGTRRRRT